MSSYPFFPLLMLKYASIFLFGNGVNKFFIIIFCLIYAFNIFAQAEITKSRSEMDKEIESLVSKSFKAYLINGKYYMFLINKNKILTVTSNCGDDISENNHKIACKALRALGVVSFSDLSDLDLAGGKNPGSVLCKKSVKGVVHFAKDHNGNSSTVCELSDGSMVSSDTLYYYGMVNAQK